MITTSNIQLSNIILINGEERKVNQIDTTSINGIDMHSASFSSVKMDEGRLLDFGFTKNEQEDRWEHELLFGFDVYVHGRTFCFGKELEYDFFFIFHTDQVHTFQNAFNLLTLQ